MRSLYHYPDPRSVSELSAVTLGEIAQNTPAQGWARFGVALASGAVVGAAASAIHARTLKGWKPGAVYGFAAPAVWVALTLGFGAIFGAKPAPQPSGGT